MVRAVCPGCGQEVDLGDSASVGDRYECENCAGEVFRVDKEGTGFVLRPVKRASCPVCGKIKELPDSTAPGDRVSCCGREFTVTY